MHDLQMTKIYSFLIIFIILLINNMVYADFLPLWDFEPFEDSLVYPPKNGRDIFMVKDMDPSEAASINGIIFTGEGESTLTTHKFEDTYSFGNRLIGRRYFVQVPSGISSAHEGVVIRFKYPVKKFGINNLESRIGTPDDRGQVTLTAYSSAGELVGTVEMEEENMGYDNFHLPYAAFGFETTAGPGVTMIVMDYGDSEKAECFGNVYYEYKTPRPFKVILPQIAHGSVSGASISSDVSIFWDHSAAVGIFSPDGVILPISILNEGSEFLLNVESGYYYQEYFKSSTIPGLDDLTVGYVVAESDYPIDGQVVYRTTDVEDKVYEADIRGCTPETYLQIPFELNQAENLNAALAIVNPSDTVAEIEIHVNDSEGSYTEFWEPPIFTLQPGEQRALFMWELWNEMPSADGNYILQLRSAVPFAAAAFYTRNWIVVGNLPVWSYQEGQAR